MHHYWRRSVDRRFLPHGDLDLNIIRKWNRSIRAMKYIPKCTSFFSLVGVASSQFILWQSVISGTSTSTPLSFLPLRLVLAAMYHFQSGLMDSRSLMRVMLWSIRRCLSSGPTSVSAGSGPSLQVRVRVESAPVPNWRSGSSLNPNCPHWYSSMVNTQPV